MSSAEDKEATAAGLRRCAADLEAVFAGLVTRSMSAWRCPAATAFETDLRDHVTALQTVAADLRTSATRLEAAADAQRAAAEEAIVGVDPGEPAPVDGPSPSPGPTPAPVGGPV